MIELWEPQQTALDQVRAQMRSSKAILLQAATGFGKTVIASAMVAGARLKGTKSMMIVPRRELLKQTEETFEEYKIPFGFVANGKEFNPYSQTYLATSGTLVNRLGEKAPKVNVVIVDETHYGDDALDRIIKFYKNIGAWIIGLSATPWKLNGQGLNKWYDSMICGPSVRWLIDNGYLSEYRMFAPHQPNLEGIKTVAGDYAKGELAERMEADRVLVGNAVEHYRRHAMGRLNIAYSTSRKHSGIICEEFRNAGIPAATIDGTNTEEERKQIIRAFARRELLVLVNNELLTFGFDLKANSGMDVTVESMSDLRPTKSLSLQMQKYGRVLRRKDFPALIFDHAGNAGIHGFPDDDREWSLAGRQTRRGGGSAGFEDEEEKMRQCDKCFFCHRPAPACPACGLVYPIKSRMVDEIDGELTEIQRQEFAQKKEKDNQKRLFQLIAIGRKNPKITSPERWAARKLTEELAKERR